jgi:hypothetical protein
VSPGKPFRYLFFAIFEWHASTARAPNPATMPAVIVTMLLSLNILALFQGLLFFGITMPFLKTIPDLKRLLGFSCYLLIGGIVWAAFVRNKAYLHFEAEFATTSERRKKVRTAALGLYIALSICLPFALNLLWQNARIHGVLTQRPIPIMTSVLSKRPVGGAPLEPLA